LKFREKGFAVLGLFCLIAKVCCQVLLWLTF
jgi:hypothetical protein